MTRQRVGNEMRGRLENDGEIPKADFYNVLGFVRNPIPIIEDEVHNKVTEDGDCEGNYMCP
jgi:hypothetical protein